MLKQGKAMAHRLFGLRGKLYVSKMKAIIAEDGDRIAIRFTEMVKPSGKFTPINLGTLANEFRLPLTVLDDYLPDLTDGAYPSGTWERLRARGYTAKMIGVEW